MLIKYSTPSNCSSLFSSLPFLPILFVGAHQCFVFHTSKLSSVLAVICTCLLRSEDASRTFWQLALTKRSFDFNMIARPYKQFVLLHIRNFMLIRRMYNKENGETYRNKR